MNEIEHIIIVSEQTNRDHLKGDKTLVKSKTLSYAGITCLIFLIGYMLYLFGLLNFTIIRDISVLIAFIVVPVLVIYIKHLKNTIKK